MSFRKLHVPSAGSGLSDVMHDEGYTEADLDPDEIDLCGLCGDEDTDDHECPEDEEPDREHPHGYWEAGDY